MTNLKTIEAKIERLRKQAAELKSKKNDKHIKEILMRMESLGITVADIQKSAAAHSKASKPKRARSSAEAKSKKSVAIKYQGPNGETWTGRGLAPKWLSTLIAQGRQKEEFLVPAASPSAPAQMIGAH